MRINVAGSYRVALCGVAALALAGCGSRSPSQAEHLPSPPPSPTAAASPTTPAGATNVTIDNQVRAELIAAGAKARGLTASDFTSLGAGMTYYAYDPATQTYWAGGELVPSPKSYRAQVSSQDDGAYTLFSKAKSGAWSAMDQGMAGPNSAPGNAACRLIPPPSVLRLWGWPANSCHPGGV